MTRTSLRPDAPPRRRGHLQGVALAVAAAVALTLHAPAGPAAAISPAARAATMPTTLPAGHPGGTLTYPLPGAAVTPESVAVWPQRRQFFASSFADGTIYRGRLDAPGEPAEVFLPAGAHGRTSATGVEVDRRGRLFVAGGSSGRVWVYDARTKRLLADLRTGASATLTNDIAVTRDGTAYVTDSLDPVVYRIASRAGRLTLERWLDLRGTPVVYQYGPGFASINLNGIVATPDGRYLLTTQTNTGALFRIDVRTRQVIRVDLGGEGAGGDGIDLIGRTLFVAQGFPNRLLQVRLSADWARGTVTGAVTDPTFTLPTGVAAVGSRLLVTNSQFGRTPPTLPFTVSSVAVVTATVRTHVRFDPRANEYPEAAVADRAGNLYVSMVRLAEIWKVSPTGRVQVVARLPRPTAPFAGLGGLAFGRDGALYALLSTFDPATHGIWRVDVAGRPGVAPRRVTALPATTQLDDLTPTPTGGFWVSDSRGSIWRVAANGRATVWSTDPLLAPPADAPFPVGANGLAYRKGYLYVANTFGRRILRLPVGDDGQALPAQVWVDDLPGDGIAFDARGDLYVTTGQDGTLVRIGPDRTVQTIATAADGLDFPAAVAFVPTRRPGRQVAYVTNFPIGPASDGQRPWVQRVRIEARR